MPDMLHLVIALSVGMALGAFFSLHLWNSVRRMTGPPGITLSSLGGFVVRTAIVVAGFYVVMDGRWERLLAALAGFVVVREVMVRRLGRKPETT
ncbi:MAG TPA: ATP synthase subunit I [Deltaproteobacteria bacterium]|jgi:F1F0 ATPase subunit 2|nr:ATP synthase subunit I [Deltaproteobacteria bacterium]HRW81472.1 ATP synthase subunit I [Desulfomonilia bacterium]HNQ85992.1 ATP synthase subunit I [Deltaproteobacteria bacterium]HNS89250.1 ATP synthase subunit I [Deltaproteobacteria bacterium]HOA44545.1 ATP synthase subunit I [Deltaproteobacteria bacterium]